MERRNITIKRRYNAVIIRKKAKYLVKRRKSTFSKGFITQNKKPRGHINQPWSNLFYGIRYKISGHISRVYCFKKNSNSSATIPILNIKPLLLFQWSLFQRLWCFYDVPTHNNITKKRFFYRFPMMLFEPCSPETPVIVLGHGLNNIKQFDLFMGPSNGSYITVWRISTLKLNTTRK